NAISGCSSAHGFMPWLVAATHPSLYIARGPPISKYCVVLLLGAAFGPRYGPVLRFYADVVKPRLGPPAELEDPRPPRFAAAVGVAFLVAASLSFLAGAPGLAWSLALVVAALAGLAAVSGICVGCEVYLWMARLRGRPLSAA
ncbi:MAG: DUF4395 domain-containing protein, partial [Acidimicrobiales bacterium]